jgi:hypothetical protein
MAKKARQRISYGSLSPAPFPVLPCRRPACLLLQSNPASHESDVSLPRHVRFPGQAASSK